jgi:hypothetical protein
VEAVLHPFEGIGPEDGDYGLDRRAPRLVAPQLSDEHDVVVAQPER